MKERKIYLVTDLGPGDGGKGGVVHKITTARKAHTVVKVGGCQGSHGVRTSSGMSFNFSHFGCGTFEGVKTHISSNMVIEPYRMLNEANNLANVWRINDIFDYITIDANALCVTPFHTFSSQLREYFRKDKPKGIVGIGAGETMCDFEEDPGTAIFAKDLSSGELSEKLNRIREKKISYWGFILDKPLDQNFLKEDLGSVKEVIKLFMDEDLVNRTVENFKILASNVKITDEAYFKSLLDRDGVIVVEGSHGVLNDRVFGFDPHVTNLRILPQFTLKMINSAGYDGEIVKLGITRGYQIRQGAGPMPTEDPEMIDQLLPGSSKLENRFQGKARVGALDFNLLNYAVEICGGPSFFDGLAVTWFDQILKFGYWDICKSYKQSNSKFIGSDGKIKIYSGSTSDQSFYQKELSDFLFTCKPNVERLALPGNESDVIDLCQQTFYQNIQIPVRMVSMGPTEKDKILI